MRDAGRILASIRPRSNAVWANDSSAPEGSSQRDDDAGSGSFEVPAGFPSIRSKWWWRWKKGVKVVGEGSHQYLDYTIHDSKGNEVPH